VAALGASAVRLAGQTTTAPDLRVLAAAALGAAGAILEALALGLLRLGGNGVALAALSGALFLAIRRGVPRPPGPSLGEQVRSALHRLGPVDRVVLGAVLATGLAALTYLWRQPFTPFDGLTYHLGEPAIWLHNGRPGSLAPTTQGFPLEAYQKNAEVLFGWVLALGRTFALGTLVMVACASLAALAVIAALWRLGITRRRAGLVAAAVLLTPVAAFQVPGASNDLMAMTWIVVTMALALGARREARLVPAAIVAGGLAVGTKATSIPLVALALAAAVLVVGTRDHPPARPTAAGAAVGLFLAGIWYVQDWIAFGAPLYPFYRFPTGPALPAIVTQYGASFLDAPRATLRAATLPGYADWLGGGLLLLAGVVVAVLLSPFLSRTLRRWVLAATAVAALEILLWLAAPFTGWTGQAGTQFLARDATRYLLPGLPTVALPTALLTRATGPVARIADALLVAAVVADVYELRYWDAPLRPPFWGLLAAALIGGASAGLTIVVRRRGASGRRRTAVPAPAVAVGAAAVLMVPTTGWLARAAAVVQPPETAPLAIPVVVRWLDQQKDWTRGGQPVGVGPVMDALLAGPTIAHRLFLVQQSTTCDDVRADLRADWLILSVPVGPSPDGADIGFFDRTTCLAGIEPAHAAGGFEIYRPGGRTVPVAAPNPSAFRVRP
jgi:hypothetical protein